MADSPARPPRRSHGDGPKQSHQGSRSGRGPASGKTGGQPDNPRRSRPRDGSGKDSSSGHPEPTDRGATRKRPERGRSEYGRPERGRPAARDGRSFVSGNDRPRRGRSPGDDSRARREDVREQPVFPAVEADVEPKQLDRFARRELSALDKDDAEFVANHLVMAGRLIDDDLTLAHEHAKAALFKGSRVGVVRETLGITAYLLGDFALALRELRTHRRLSGSNANLPMMVDCERGLDRPQRAIELAHSVDSQTLDTSVRVELAIALSGARLDLGQPDRALLELQIPELNPDVAYSYSPALFDAYAVVLDELGRSDEAALWGERANIAAAALDEASGGTHDIVVIDLGDEEDAPSESSDTIPADSSNTQSEASNSPDADNPGVTDTSEQRP